MLWSVIFEESFCFLGGLFDFGYVPNMRIIISVLFCT